jgi:hypothetical protein
VTGSQELTPTILTPPVRGQNQFSVSTKNASQGEIIVRYDGIAGNQPRTYKNILALWNGALPNMTVDPLRVTPIESNNQPNSQPFKFDFEATDYCITYQVAEDISAMCAMTSFSFSLKARILRALAFWRWANVRATPPEAVSIKILKITTDSVQIIYNTLPGYQPQKFGNWIGIWPGWAIPYGSPEPLGRAMVDSDYSQGIVNMGPVSLYPGFSYTLTYFMQAPEKDKQRSSAASLLYFSV